VPSFYCYVDGVDYGPTGIKSAIHAIHAKTSGIDKIGDATLVLYFTAAALPTIIPTREVLIYQTGAAPNGYFGGFIKKDGIKIFKGPGQERWVTLDCQDYNCLLDNIVRDAAPANLVTISAGTFHSQIAALVDAMQRAGHVSVERTIDATSYVAHLTGSATLPAITVKGESLRQGLRKIMLNAIANTAALRPRFNMQLLSDGAGGVTCALVVWDGATLTSPVATFTTSAAPGIGEKAVKGVEQVDDATMPIVNRIQSMWRATLGTFIYTYAGATSGATYYNPYINHGIGAGGASGYWMDLPVEDTKSTTSAEAQAAVNQTGKMKEFPRQTYSVIEEGTYVRGGQIVRLKTDKIDQNFEVSAIDLNWHNLADATEIELTLQCGLPLLELFDNGVDGIAGPPILGDNVSPDPPVSYSLTSNVINPATGKAQLTFAIGPSPSPDVLNYMMVNSAGPHARRYDVGLNTGPTIELDSGESFSFLCYAQDASHTSEPANAGVPITGTAAGPVYNDLINPDYENPDRLDVTLPYHHTRSVTNGGTATRDTTTSYHGAACCKLSTSGSIGSTAQMLFPMTVVRGDRYGLIFFGKASVGSTNVDALIDWYDSTQAYISTSTATRSLTTSFARYTGAVSPPSNAAFFKLSFKNSVGSRDIRIDTVSFLAQVPKDSIEDGSVDGAKLASSIDYAGTFKFLSGSSLELQATDSTGGTLLKFKDQDGVQSGYAKSVGRHSGGTAHIEIGSADLPIDVASEMRTMRTLKAGVQGDIVGGYAKIIVSGDSSDTDDLVQLVKGSDGSSLGNVKGDGSVLFRSAFALDAVSTQTGTFTAALHRIYLCNSASAFTANLPDATTCAGRFYTFKQIKTGVVTIDGNGSQTIDGILTYPLLEKNQTVEIYSDGSNWRIHSQSGLILESDSTRWLGVRQTINVPQATNSGGNATNYAATTLFSRFEPPSAETYWVETVTWWVRPNGTNNGSNYWTLRQGHEGNTFGGSVDLDLNTSAKTAGTATFLSGSPNVSLDFSSTSQYDFFLEIRKDNGAPTSIDVWGVSLIVRKVYS
jgi:hypothetical protein